MRKKIASLLERICHFVILVMTAGFLGVTFTFLSTAFTPSGIALTIPYAIRPAQPFAIEVPAKPRHILIYFHGHGATIQTISTDPLTRPLFDALLANGYIIAYSNAHGNAWGNAASIEDYKQLSMYLQETFQIQDTVFLSESMGGLAGLMLVAQHQVPVRCWAGIYPVTNTTDYHDPRRQAEILAAHANDNIDALNPIEQPASSFTIPMRIYASPRDTVVPVATNTEKLLPLLRDGTWVRTTGEHGDKSNFQVDDLVHFFNTCGS